MRVSATLIANSTVWHCAGQGKLIVVCQSKPALLCSESMSLRLTKKLYWLRCRSESKESGESLLRTKLSSPGKRVSRIGLESVAEFFTTTFPAFFRRDTTSAAFHAWRSVAESRLLDFTSNADEPYNDLFFMRELCFALDTCDDIAPVLDDISYATLRNVVERSRPGARLLVFNLLSSQRNSEKKLQKALKGAAFWTNVGKFSL